MVTHGHKEFFIPFRIEVVGLDAGLDDGGRAEADLEEGVNVHDLTISMYFLFLEADLEEGVRQVAAADIEEHVVGVRQTLGFNSVKFQCSMKKGQRRN